MPADCYKQKNYSVTQQIVMAFVMAFLFMGNAKAVLTDSLGIGNAKALGLGHAVTADPPGIDSIHYNPAGLAKVKGRKKHVKLIAGSFDIALELGDYNEDRAALLELARIEGAKLGADGIPIIENPDEWFYNESYQTTSETEGASMMLPFGIGQTDFPALIFPLGGVSISPPGSGVTFGTNVYTPLAAGFYRAEDDPGRFIGQRLSFLLLTYFSPSIAVEVNDQLMFGASINFNYAGVGFEVPFRSDHLGLLALPFLQAGDCDTAEGNAGAAIPICENLGPYDVLGTLTFSVEKELAIGFNMGVLWEPTPWLTLGAVYQSPVSMDMEGDFSWENSEKWLNFLGELSTEKLLASGLDLIGVKGQTFVEGTANLEMEMPEHYALGMSLQLTPSVKVNVDYKFTGWSSWESIPVKFSQNIDVLALGSLVQSELAEPNSVTFPLGLQDTWNWAMGVEYQFSDQLALRMGVEDRPSSIPTESRSPLLPIASGTFYGIGFGYKAISGAQWDVGLAYFHSEVEMPGGSSDLGNSTDPTKAIYNPFQGQDITATLDVILLEMSYSQDF
ncbi:hypothetical protein A9Q99_21240 [Gammaproteobacteria bacterium 45_16_T64]|nr:hypothetical protein A9Q99_21240 [Gammaproteobacteria bacterium 45_16_T64]